MSNRNVNVERLYVMITAIKANEVGCQTPLLPQEVANDLLQHLGAEEALETTYSLVDKAKEEATAQLQIKETSRGRTAKTKRIAISLGRQQLAYLYPTAVEEINTINEQLRAELPYNRSLAILSFILQLATILREGVQ